MSVSSIVRTGVEVRLASRPADDMLREDTFEVVEVDVPDPDEGAILVRNEWMLLAAAMRDLVVETSNSDLPMPRFEIGRVPWALTVGTVEATGSDAFAVGDLVYHRQGWRQYATGPAAGFAALERGLLPSSEYFLSQGPTAYRGMVEMARVGAGDTVFITSAAGGVGSLAGQIARACGAKKVIGSAGSADKVAWLTEELGFDAAFDRHDGRVFDHLREFAPDGVDVVFDNVGGPQLEDAIRASAPRARLALCGVLSQRDPMLPLGFAIRNELEIRPFSTSYAPATARAWQERFGDWLRDGTITFPYTAVRGGPGAAPEALRELVAGRCRGQVLVDLRPAE
ncbi:MDR family NADP-dependent oxidoreductase [Nocardia alba]|uniref:Enoyl reductase (ER) domain-containing protein n=1 Tax=Nocardia alba TaxID=225051 RepID=A0A4R1F6J1_9NOCA|nr:NADP-dependent oxidoreductase [Nocardia alba]TCJ89907.1 hypothetical protein DFR71_6196 [Nocardia alba]